MVFGTIHNLGGFFMAQNKSRRVFSFLTSLVMLLSLSSMFCFTSAFAALEGEWGYEIEGGGVTITSYIGTSKVVTVPAKLNNQRVVKVASLSNNNFKTSITSITFSEGILQIGDSLCKGYSSLEKVTLPDSLTSIGKDAFRSCIALKGITVPTSVSSIGEGAFAGCTSLISATLNCRAEELPEKLFAGDTMLNTVSLSPAATSLGDLAFESCQALKTMILPDSIKSIGNSAFSNCYGLSSITLPANLKSIGSRAFYNCSNLTSLYIPSKTKTINEAAFSSCRSLDTVYFSDSVTVIKGNIFLDSGNIRTVVFGGENHNFDKLSSTSLDFTLYYPAKCADSWSNYTYASQMKSYQAPSGITITGSKTVSPGKEVKLTVKVNGDFPDAYTLTSSTPTVATIAPDGTVIARATGSTTITVTTLTGITKDFVINVMPAAPTNLSVKSKTTSSADLSWSGTYNATGYIVYRSTKKTSGFKEVGKTTTTSFTDKGLTKGKTYYYKLKSYAGSTQVTSDFSAVKSVKITSPAPATITAKKAAAGSAKITWGKSMGASGYEVYMASSKTGKFTKIKTVTKATTLSATKSELTKGKTYYFKVRSYVTVSGKKVYSDFTKAVGVKV